MVFDKFGIRFQYPDGWVLDAQDALDGEQAVAVYSPGGAFWSVVVRDADEEPARLISAALETMRNDENPYDRQVRDSIERHRAKGRHYCNVGDGKGYFIANTRQEFEQFKRYYLGAAVRKMQNMSAMDDTADERWGRMPRKTSPLQPSLLS